MNDLDTRNLAARRQALAAAASVAVEPTAAVGYRSAGRLLIVGPAAAVLDAARRAADGSLRPHLLVTDGRPADADSALPLVSVDAHSLKLSGHLGAFTLSDGGDGDDSTFDLVLDLQPQPFFRYTLNPLGYAAPGTDPETLDAALEELAALVGEFEKPTYFRYDPNICAHGRSGIPGCRRCIDACPAGAITSLAEQIEIDPYRCLGGGGCASACPTGAITYRYPRPADSADRLRALLRGYREAGGEQPRLVFHDDKTPAPQTPANLLPVEVEEIGSVGLDLWLTALAYGARQVLLLAPHGLAAEVERELRTQLATCHALLDALGYPPSAVGMHPAGAGELPEAADIPENVTPAGFAGSNDKRATLFFALDWLHAQAETPADITELPAAAPFGEVLVDQAACTLCMGCVSVCPAAALGAGGDTPRLDFVEANCVQCGMCQTACPEGAIRTHARFDFNRERRRRRRVLNEEAPFCCIACGKPFATRSVIDKMTAKLADHAMFQQPSALRRLQMCGDCRVKDMFIEQQKLS